MNYVIVKRVTDGIEISDVYIQGKNIEKLSKGDTVFGFSENLGKNDLEFAVKYLMHGDIIDDNDFRFAGKWLTVICIVRDIPENKHKEYVRAALKTIPPITRTHGLFVKIVGNPEKLKLYETAQIMDEIKKAVEKDTTINFGMQYEDNVKNPSVIAAIESDIPGEYIT